MQTNEFQINFLDLAFLRLSVSDNSGGSSGKCICQRLLPLRRLRPGYRHVRLRAPNNTPLDHSTLFIYSRLEEEEYIYVNGEGPPTEHLKLQQELRLSLDQVSIYAASCSRLLMSVKL